MDALNRWQDRIAIGIGLWLCVSPWILKTPESAAWCAILVGIAVIVLATEDFFLTTHIDDWANIVLGIGLMISPWAWGYAEHQPAVLNAVLSGLALAGIAAWVFEHDMFRKTRPG